jgi:CO dehydrogenase/acetyl-CoA synthase delta subunit
MLKHVLARLGMRRSGWRVRPGLYRLGAPGPDSPVFVSANYTLSFDALRGALSGIDSYILVLDTFGINVWCAAGKGTFSTDELVGRIEQTRLADEVSTRTLIVPQLGATGVCAREVLRRTGFKVRFGPIRAVDIPEFLERGDATEEMRRVTFGLKDRTVLIPVEGKVASPVMAGLALGAYLADGPAAAAGVGAAGIAGFAGFPLLMPWIPGKDFSTKGFMLGGAVALAAAGAALVSDEGSAWQKAARAASYMLALPAITSFIALNFTGATPFASPSGVRREIFKYVPVMAAMAASGVVLNGARHLLGRKRG